MEIQQKTIISESMDHPVQIGMLYKHYKGNIYKVLQVGRYSENPETLFVIYQALYKCPTYGENQVWCRPLLMFTETVEINGVEQPRFRQIEQSV